MNTKPANSIQRLGFTMVEMMIAMSLAVGLFLILGLASNQAADSISAGVTREDLGMRAQRAMHSALAALRELELAPLGDLSLGDNTITFHRVEGYNAGPLFGADMSLAFEYETGELNDDMDNDGDGLVDEGQLVMTLDVGGAGEQRRVLCKGVAEFLQGETDAIGDENNNGFTNESGFFIDIQGNVVNVHLTLQAVDVNNQVLTRTLETSTRVRN